MEKQESVRSAMEMDLVQLIAGWDYDPKDFSGNVRRIRGIDGREKVQLRTELGLSQMEMEGRPDGKRPAGFPYALDWAHHRLEEHRKKGLPPETFRLDEADVERLQRESIQCQLRGTCLLALGEHAGAIRDIEHNLAIARLLSQYAPERGTQAQYRQLVSPLIIERTRAEVVFHVGRGEAAEAFREVERAIREIVEQLDREGQDGRAASSPALAALREMAGEVRRKYLAGQE